MTKGAFLSAFKYLIIPVNFWRTVEFNFTLRNIDLKPNDEILDIGSPKFLSLYIAKQHKGNLFATDIENYFVQPFSELRDIEKIDHDHYHLKVENGCRLSFPDKKFDKVYSISVLEHIPAKGDIECIRQIARVLKPDGKCILTIPFAKHSHIEYRKPDFYWASNSPKGPGKKVFYQRRYSQEDIQQRIILPSGLKCEKLVYVGEKIFTKSNNEICNYLPAFTGPFQPLLSKILLSKETEDWRSLKKPLCALMVLKKKTSNI